MLPKLEEIQKKGIDFETLFQGKIKRGSDGEQGNKVVSVSEFTEMLKKVFGDQNGHPEIKIEEW